MNWTINTDFGVLKSHVLLLVTMGKTKEHSDDIKRDNISKPKTSKAISKDLGIPVSTVHIVPSLQSF